MNSFIINKMIPNSSSSLDMRNALIRQYQSNVPGPQRPSYPMHSNGGSIEKYPSVQMRSPVINIFTLIVKTFD